MVTFDELYNNNYKNMVSIATYIMHNDTDSEDIVQEAFLKLYRTWPNLHFKTLKEAACYANKTVKTIITDAARRKDTLKKWESTLQMRMETRQKIHSTSVEVEWRETMEEFRTALNNMPPSYQMVLLMRAVYPEDIGGSSTAIGAGKIIQQNLGITRGAVKALTFRARQKARQQCPDLEYLLAG